MSFVRAELKQSAKEQLVGKWGSVIGAVIILGLISGCLTFLAQTCLDSIPLYKDGLRGWVSFLSSVVMILVVSPLALGQIAMMIKVVRYREVSATAPFDGYRRFVPSVILVIAMSIFISLWTLLLIIPGIIKAYSYSMAIYILADDENISPLDAITKSREMMNGHKWEFFVLQLSFILWGLLVAVTLGLASLYVYPYMQVTLANFYERLKAESIVEELEAE